jgi:Ca2+-binding EF-hand superfamily protein
MPEPRVVGRTDPHPIHPSKIRLRRPARTPLIMITHPLQLLCSATIAGALASCATPSDKDLFRDADRNHDGQLTLIEVNNMALPRLFDRFDLNHDDKVTVEEAQAVEPDFDMRHFRERDLDHDGAVSYPEYLHVANSRGGLKRQFAEVDSNHDGVINKPEADAHLARMEQRDAAGHHRAGL